MTDHEAPQLPAWVVHPDGRVAPFDPDLISQSLFRATEAVGRPDPFLARQLTDGALHFLAAELGDGVPSTSQVAEVVVKVVRELGQPALAAALSRPDDAASPHSTGSALPPVFAADIAAAHEAGLITIAGLQTQGLTATVLGPPSAAGLVETLEVAREITGEVVALDAPEFHLAEMGPSAVATFVRQLTEGIRQTGLHAVVNLNQATPPSWADDLAPGPLFSGQVPAPEPRELSRLREELLHQLLHLDVSPRLRIDWHLGPRDLAAEPERLEALAGLALSYPRLAFTFDRPRQPVHLAEGLTRQVPAVLVAVGLNLPRLVDQSGDPERFLANVGTLARLALSAAKQKRDFLRQRAVASPALAEGFRLARARLVVAPIALDEAVRRMLGRGPCAGGQALELARKIVQRMRDVLRAEGLLLRLETCVDGWMPQPLPWGLSPDDPAADVKGQLRVGKVLHSLTETGTVTLRAGERAARTEAVAWVRQCWEEKIVRVRFV